MAEYDYCEQFEHLLRLRARTYGQACQEMGVKIGQRQVIITGDLLRSFIQGERASVDNFLDQLFAKCPKDTVLMNCNGQVIHFMTPYHFDGSGQFYEKYAFILGSKEWTPGAEGGLIELLEPHLRPFQEN